MFLVCEEKIKFFNCLEYRRKKLEGWHNRFCGWNEIVFLDKVNTEWNQTIASSYHFRSPTNSLLLVNLIYSNCRLLYFKGGSIFWKIQILALFSDSLETTLQFKKSLLLAKNQSRTELSLKNACVWQQRVPTKTRLKSFILPQQLSSCWWYTITFWILYLAPDSLPLRGC